MRCVGSFAAWLDALGVEVVRSGEVCEHNVATPIADAGRTVATLFGLITVSDSDTQVSVRQMESGVSPNTQIKMPRLIFAADILARGDTANILLGLAFVGHRSAGLPITACTLFGSDSGSTPLRQHG